MLKILRTLSMTTESGAIPKKLQETLLKVGSAYELCDKQTTTNVPALIAVTKTKPPSVIIEAYACGQRHFGENYVNEVVEKSNFDKIRDSCPDIRWHFIGHLQRKSVNKLIAGVSNLYMIETVDSSRLASQINNALKLRKLDHVLKVLVQVYTSGETAKSGCDPSECVDLVNHIKKDCPALEFRGLMTIGSFNHDHKISGPNPDFQKLVALRSEVSAALSIPIHDMELSMGMSGDFEHAIEMGSTIVRVGSTIFGARSVANQPQPDHQEKLKTNV